MKEAGWQESGVPPGTVGLGEEDPLVVVKCLLLMLRRGKALGDRQVGTLGPHPDLARNLLRDLQPLLAFL